MQNQKKIGLILGIVVFIALLLLPTPEAMSASAWRMVAVVALIAIWWISEALELSVTALLPIILLPVMDITSVSVATLSYANEAIFLFMGGFMIAIALFLTTTGAAKGERLLDWESASKLPWNILILFGGGLAVNFNGKTEVLPLPIGGIMSDRSGMEVADYRKQGETVKQMGCTLDSPFMTLSFLSLLVIPELRIGEKGLFSYSNFNWIN